ncbi:hypothetical protein [Xanthomonas campestris]|nr:hypothetical protein [Xanthomonas campestris]
MQIEHGAMTSRRSLAGNSLLQLQHRRALHADEYGAADTDSRSEKRLT